MSQTQTNEGWPSEPYKGLANYECADERLFAGRSADIKTCAGLLANTQTKLLILHGQTGCGKSSFLRAGLIPALEKNGAGYFFLKRPSAADPAQWMPSFIRCGADPISRIAEEIFLFTAQPVEVPTAAGPQLIDLKCVRRGVDNKEQFIQACSVDQGLCDVLKCLSDQVRQTLVFILDQVEEVITLNALTPGQRKKFSEFIKDLATSAINIRLVLAIRKDHSGQFIGSIEVNNEMSMAFRTYFLADLSITGIEEAILRPTLEVLPGGALGPRSAYQFEFAPGVVKEILNDLKRLIPAGATLPVMQIVCRSLYEKLPPAPARRVVDMALYKKNGGIAGRVKQHLLGSLHAVLKGQPHHGEAQAGLELRWLQVLNKLVQEEGDGRVHTDVVPRATLESWAGAAGVQDCAGKVIEQLTAPNLLILRRFTVFAPGGEAEVEMVCLGHDMIGIALVEALREADARQKVGVSVRKRTRFVKGVSLAAACIGGLAAIFFAYRADLIRTQTVESLLTRSINNRTDNVLASLAYAREAETVAEQGFLRDDAHAKKALRALLAGWPTIIVSGQQGIPMSALSNASFYPTYLLPHRVGFATFGQDGIVRVSQVIQGGVEHQIFSAVAPFVTAAGTAQTNFINVSDASPNLMLALYRSNSEESPGGVVAFSTSATPKVFSYADLITGGAEPHAADAKKMGLYGLSKSSVVLYSMSEDKKWLHLKFLSITDDLALRAGIDREIAAPTDSLLVNGSRLVFFYYPPDSIPKPGIPALGLTKFESTDIFTDEAPQAWETNDFSIIKSCLAQTGKNQMRTDRSPDLNCELTAVPDLQQTDLVVLGLWELPRDRFGAFPRGYISNLVVVDLNTHVTSENDLRAAATARQECGLAGLDKSSNPKTQLSDEDVPTFLVKGQHGLVFGYTARTSAVLVYMSTKQPRCKEIYFPEVDVTNWSASADGKKLLAVSKHAGFVWDLQPDVSPIDERTVADRIKAVCSMQFDMFGKPDGLAPAQVEERKALLEKICR